MKNMPDKVNRVASVIGNWGLKLVAFFLMLILGAYGILLLTGDDPPKNAGEIVSISQMASTKSLTEDKRNLIKDFEAYLEEVRVMAKAHGGVLKEDEAQMVLEVFDHLTSSWELTEEEKNDPWLRYVLGMCREGVSLAGKDMRELALLDYEFAAQKGVPQGKIAYENLKKQIEDKESTNESSQEISQGIKRISIEAIDKELEICMNQNQDTQGTISCINEAIEKWDLEVMRVYDLLIDTSPEDVKKALKDAQESWEIYREKQYSILGEVYFDIYNSLDGGTMWLIAQAESEMKIPRQRAINLDYFVNEIQLGMPSFPEFYPEKETEDHQTANLGVKNNYFAIGKALNKKEKAVAAYEAYCIFRDKEVFFMAVLYGKTKDEGFILHNCMVLNKDHIKMLEGIMSDMEQGEIIIPD
ncbi:MAG: hypothetical protein CVU95_03415 [Firmicutes bacterium HGW-Firmicutes-2]|nr:MAG: hypothetical protein CVU95_03415 [Firmicutes bacterium HGW-Firmicutes-2]